MSATGVTKTLEDLKFNNGESQLNIGEVNWWGTLLPRRELLNKNAVYIPVSCKLDTLVTVRDHHDKQI